MSSVWKYPNHSPRKQELTWMNLIFQSHDQFCDCNDPPLHFMVLINKDSNFKKPLSDIQNIKCLLTGATKDGTTEGETIIEDNFGFLEGELEDLFAEKDTPKETTEEPR